MDSESVAFVAKFKANSVKQTQERFLKKHEASFFGSWRMEVKDNSGCVLLVFRIFKDDYLDDNIPF